MLDGVGVGGALVDKNDAVGGAVGGDVGGVVGGVEGGAVGGLQLLGKCPARTPPLCLGLGSDEWVA